MSYSTALILFKMSLTVPAFHLEDVYITGILPSKVVEMSKKQLSLVHSSTSISTKSGSSVSDPKSVKPVVIIPKDDYRFSFFPAKSDPCVYNKIISSHHISMKQIREMYAKVLKVRLKPEDCPKLKPKELRPYSPGRCMNKLRNKHLSKAKSQLLRKKTN